MAYYVSDIPEMVKLLRATKKQLEMKSDGSRYEYVCHAMNRAAEIKNTPERIRVITSEMIYEALDNIFTFPTWLRSRGHKRPYSFKQLQKLRQKWLSKMIADLNRYYTENT